MYDKKQFSNFIVPLKNIPNILKNMQTGKRGRPKIHESLVHFGMKITPKEREKVRALAEMKGLPASRALMELVEKAIANEPESQMEKSFKKAPTPMELLKLSAGERNKILKAQAKKAAKMYRENPDLIADGADDIMEY